MIWANLDLKQTLLKLIQIKLDTLFTNKTWLLQVPGGQIRAPGMEESRGFIDPLASTRNMMKVKYRGVS